MRDNLISKESLPKNINKIKASSAEIVVHGTKENPYYEIEYFDLSDNEIHIGFSSYKLDVVFGYLEKYFDIVNEENKSDQVQDYHSDDLISRKAVLNILTEARVKDSILCSPAFVEMLTQRIKKIPTAFDKEKVIEELEDYLFEKYCVEGDEKIAEIVEKGGIE